MQVLHYDSMRVEIVDYDRRWPSKFESVGRRLREAFIDDALYIHHIGSTSVPGFPAKDVIDVQVTVAELGIVDVLKAEIESRGLIVRTGIGDDHIPPWRGDPSEWVKRYIRESSGQRTHVHVRELGRPNQRYAVLFRDFLRSSPEACARYLAEKRRLAVEHNFDSLPYSVAKDDVCDEIIKLAETWADETSWVIPNSDA